MRTSWHRRYSHALGSYVRVSVTPIFDFGCHREGKDAVAISVTAPNGTKWRPAAPLCLSALYEADTSLGRREAADAAIDFFDAAVDAGEAEPPK